MERPSTATSAGDLSITAQYTSAVWAWGKLPCAELFATRDAQRVFDVTNAALAAASVLSRRTPLRYALLHRHAMIDHVVREAAPRRVLELAAGLSRRGATLSADAGLHYTELDLPAVVAKKRELLERTAAGRAVLARGNFELVAGDVATAVFAARRPRDRGGPRDVPRRRRARAAVREDRARAADAASCSISRRATRSRRPASRGARSRPR